MAWEYTPYTIPFAVTILCSLVFGAYLLHRTRERDWDVAVGSLAVVCLGTLVWGVAALLQVSTTSFELMVLAEQWTYVGTPIVVIGWLVFAAAYTGHDDLVSVPVVGGLALVLGSGSLLALTNGSHELLWASPAVVDYGSFSSLTYEQTSAYYAFVIAAFGTALLGVALLGRFMLTSRTRYRSQMAALIVAAAAPLMVSLWVVLGLGPHPTVELSPIGFVVSVAAFTYAIERHQLLDLAPMARTRVVEHMREGYVVLGENERIVDLNPAAKRLLGVGEDVIGADVRAILPEVEPLLDGDGRPDTELSVTVGGDRRYLTANSSTLAENGTERGSLLLLRDVTDRRQVENRYQELIEHSADVIAVLDETGTVTYASPSHETVLGIDPAAIEGMNGLERVHGDDRDRLEDLLDSLFERPGETERFEFRASHADGEWHVFEGIARNLLDNPVVEGLVINSRDITERKRRERELERQNDRLEDFANLVSHDLRNPLQIAEAYLEQARQSGDEDAFERVETAHDRMEAIIADVLELARQGRSLDETEVVWLSSVANEAWNTVRTETATLTVARDCELRADPERLRRLLENLFRNSIEHAGPAVTVTVGALPDGHLAGERSGSQQVGGARTGFFVEDDGPGIPEDEREHVFESGYTTATGGTGFGLAIVEGIASVHGWQVSVTDAATGGSTAVADGAPGRSADASEDRGGARFEFTPRDEAGVEPT
ncbi:histidine kinase N-terminal 7TM domain-containing protein [Halorientalis halophila]|uniref:sensor histidine kinase n=1 Tax=Halorientalis halophila TaxID=3108499 RepID=UPI00300AFCBF